MTHAQQRSFYRLDPALSERVDVALPVCPACDMTACASCSPIPTGEASDSDWGAFVEAIEDEL